MFKLEFETTNVAFQDDVHEACAILLHTIADSLEGAHGKIHNTIHDDAGNRIGFVKINTP